MMTRALAVALVLTLATATFAQQEPPPPPATPEPVPAAQGTLPVATTVAAGVRVKVFAMGQADSMLIVGAERSVLVDCGAPLDGNKDGWKHVKDDIVRLCGRPHVDAAILTHFHSDHSGEAADADHPHPSGFFALFAEGVTVTTLIDNGDTYPSYGFETHPHEQWLAALPQWKAKGVFHDRHVPEVNERYPIGHGADLRFVASRGNKVLDRRAKEGRFEKGANPSENDYSIAFVLKSGEFEMFSGGDLSGEDVNNHSGGRGGHSKRHDWYDDIETSVAPIVGNVEVLRVDHHGSSHSSNEAFLRTLRPEVSICSCGGGNAFHHPAPETVARLAPWGPIFVTSGLAKEWQGRSDAPKVIGDITIAVSPDGATYTISGKDGEVFRGRSFSDAEEAQGLDHPGRKAGS
jgi:hypothetical protein